MDHSCFPVIDDGLAAPANKRVNAGHHNVTRGNVTSIHCEFIVNPTALTNTETEHAASPAAFMASPHYRDRTRSQDLSGNSANGSDRGRQDTCGGASGADQSLDSGSGNYGTAKTWWTPQDAIAAKARAEASERRIRADARQEIRCLHEKPWVAGKRLSDLVRYFRQRHTESIGRSRP